MSAPRRGVPLAWQIVAGMAAGLWVGLWFGPKAAPLGELGKLAIQLIKAGAAPLLFLVIVNAVVKTHIGLRAAARMSAAATVNAVIALTIGLVISNALQPGRHLPAQHFANGAAAAAAAGGGAAAGAGAALEPLKLVSGIVPTSFVEPFVTNAVLTLVLLALLLGFGLRKVAAAQSERGEEGHAALTEALGTLLEVMETVLGWIVRLAPLAVFGVVAKSVGEHGLAPVKGLAAYVGAALLGHLIHVVVTYQLWLVLYARMNLRFFWEAAKEPVVYALGANSSLATLPVTLKALDELGVSKSSATLGACVGTNLNNDGIILYEAMAVLFVAQAHGIHLTLGQQIMAALSCLVAAMGIAGVPEAGFISLSLVLATVGLPTELLPLLLTVDWIIARSRSAVNVLSDMLVSIILDRWEGRRFERAPVSAGRPLQFGVRR